MKTSFKYAILALACVFGGCIGGFLAVNLYLDHLSVGQAGVVRAKRIEVIDDQGRARGILGSDEKNVFLRLLSSEGEPEITASVPSETGAKEPSNENSGSANSASTPPGIVIADGSKKGEVRIEVGYDGEGRVVIGTDPFGERVTLGRFLIGDVQPDPDRYGGWGLQVVGRGKNGQHLATGVGISTRNGIDGPYLSPVSR
jgi:hypothetical protein